MSSSAPAGHVLVTAAAGFVGSNGVELLAQDPRNTVTTTDAGSEERLAQVGRLDTVTAQRADLWDPNALASLVAGVDVIVHSLPSEPRHLPAGLASHTRSMSGQRMTCSTAAPDAGWRQLSTLARSVEAYPRHTTPRARSRPISASVRPSTPPRTASVSADSTGAGRAGGRSSFHRHGPAAASM